MLSVATEPSLRFIFSVHECHDLLTCFHLAAQATWGYITFWCLSKQPPGGCAVSLEPPTHRRICFVRESSWELALIMRYSTGHACERGIRFTGGSFPAWGHDRAVKQDSNSCQLQRDVMGSLRFNHSEAAKNDIHAEWKSWHVGNPNDAAFCIREKLNKAHLLM